MAKNLDFQVETMHYNKLLLAIDDDDTKSSSKAFNYACTVAKIYQIPLGIVSVLETGDLNIYQSLSPDVLEQRRSEISQDLNQYVQKAQDFGVLDVLPLLGEGNPSHIIVEEIVPNFEPDLIICGSDSHPSSHRFLGTHASYISRNAPCSVIIVR